MKLEILDHEYSICKLPAGSDIPKWAANHFCSIAITDNELSIVARTEFIPAGIEREDGWCVFRIAGQLEFDMIGIIAEISGILAAAKISIFVVSTFDTDYFMVKSDVSTQACDALQKHGYSQLEDDQR